MDRPALLRRAFLARFHKPSRIFFLAHDPDGNWHIGMVFAANFGTLAVIDALALGFEPGFVHPAWNRVDADAKRRDGKRVDHICCRDLNVDNLPNGHDRFVIHGELADITWLEVSRLDHLRIEFKAAALILRVAIGPIPLLAGYLHGDV